jgi:ankyrin repeat protein
MLEYVCAKLTSDRALAQEHYPGRTLLHEAAAAGNLSIAELLLRLGADPDSRDSGGHTPLNCLANECVHSGGRVVHALVEAGGGVDADDGVKRCTPLQMAARRGNVDVARALLDCGANLESRDKLGDTPLGRAVNCGKVEVVSFLIASGADVHSMGSKGLTPMVAARTSAMKQSLHRAIDK